MKLAIYSSVTFTSGIIPVIAHAEVNILNFNLIDSFIFYSSTNRLSNDIHVLQLLFELHFVTFLSKLYILIFYLYYRPFLPQTGNTSERPFCRYIM